MSSIDRSQIRANFLQLLPQTDDRPIERQETIADSVFNSIPHRSGRGRGLDDAERAAIYQRFQTAVAENPDAVGLIQEDCPRPILMISGSMGFALLNSAEKGDVVGAKKQFTFYNAVGLHNGKRYVVVQDGREYQILKYGVENEITALQALASQPQVPTSDFEKQLGYFTELNSRLILLAKADPEIHVMAKKAAREAIAKLREARETYEDMHALPIFTPALDASKFYNMGSVEEYTESPIHEGIHIEKGSRPLRPFKVTEEFLEGFSKIVYDSQDFAWEFGLDGCYARATFIRDQLIACGVPPESIGRIFIVEPQSSQWPYHVAITVRYTDDNGDECLCVIDGGEAPAEDTWARQHAKGNEISDRLGVDEPISIPYRPTEYNCYLTPHDMIMRIEKDDGTNQRILKFEWETDDSHRDNLLKLSHLRKDRDTLLIDNILDD